MLGFATLAKSLSKIIPKSPFLLKAYFTSFFNSTISNIIKNISTGILSLKLQLIDKKKTLFFFLRRR